MTSLKSTLLLAAAVLVWGATPAHAQRKTKIKTKGEATTAPADPASRLLPLFGGLTPAQAEKVVGTAFLADIERSFASRAEASRFFSTKGYEYLIENQADTAQYRFNLAWLLDQKNPEAYRGLGIIASQKSTPDASIALLNQGLAIDPKNANLLSDLGASYLIVYQQSKKKKDLTTAATYLEQAVALNTTNADTWQQMARVYFYQEKYPQAWEAIHKGQQINIGSLDFELISELQAKLPDPAGRFK
jgi:tetratricopeptide (TPR) repeat protein